jgi:SPX domain
VSPSRLEDAGFGVVDTDIELEGLSGLEEAASGDVRTRTSWEARRKEKWNRKLEELADREEMKFSHSIQFNAVPDWSSNYISYSNLKKLYVSNMCLMLFHSGPLTVPLVYIHSRSRSIPKGAKLLKMAMTRNNHR